MIGRFLSYVEIKTKVTSIFAFALTLAYLFSIHQPIDLLRTVVFFGSMFLFDLTTTAINNYMDTKTNDQILQFNRRTALVMIYLFFILATVLGIWLALMTDVVVLLLGALCFFCGVVYSYGPIPISRQPWGEVISGLFYGLLIPFILLYVNMPEGTYLTLELSWETVNLSFRVYPMLTVLLLAVAPFCTTANIMLANNTSDVQKDILVKRYTLPYYLGTKRSLYLFAGLYYLVYLSVIVMTIVRMLHPICLLFLLTLIPVQKNINKFFEKQVKEETFIVSVQNYVLIMGGLTLAVLVSGFLT